MSVSSFKFVSPGVFINEIDNSFIPKSSDAIGPVVVGRATRGLAMQPVRIESYSDFVELYGDTVPGNAGGDVYRYGNKQSPMYGTYAAKAFMNANVAPLTYVRLMGCQHTNAIASGYAGWATTSGPSVDLTTTGGAYGLWLFPSGTTVQLGTGSLAAVWYADSATAICLSGTLRGSSSATATDPAASSKNIGTGMVIGSDSNGAFTVVVTGSDGTREDISFNFDDNSELFIRKRFNTNPQMGNTNSSNFYPTASVKKYWLGETFEQELRDGINSGLTGGGTDVTTAELQGVILQIASGSGTQVGPHSMKGISFNEAVAGWFIGQDLGVGSGSYSPEDAQKLFRLVGRGHAEWLNKNAKVSIENIRASTTTVTDYGTFSLLIRSLNDTDSNVQILERFDNLTLDPTSVNFVARRLGDQYSQWSDTDRRLRVYGEYANVSKYVRVEMNEDVEQGATDPTLVPFGYYGPPKFKDILAWNGDRNTGAGVAAGQNQIGTSYIFCYTHMAMSSDPGENWMLMGNALNCSGSLLFPVTRLRHSSSDGGLPDQTDAYFGFQSTRTQTSTRNDASVADPNRLWSTDLVTDPVGSTNPGIDAFSYIFSLDDIEYDSTKAGYFYSSGSRRLDTSYTAGSNSYKTLLDADINRFTAPFWGGFDALDIKQPNPFYNEGIGVDETTSYTYNTLKRALDTIADPEFINMNLLAVPGVTNTTLTTHMINICEERADALAVIDLPDVYVPAHEQRLTKVQRRRATPSSAAIALKDRRLDSSYGCTYYPWVQTRDEGTGQLVWLPPSAVMMGVFASSQAASDLWFAPAGFNRGGLTDGAGGLTVVNVTERLSAKDRDTLYENRINPIASFPSSGIVVFGQKTLQESQSSLDRVNVRRLVIYLKKQISILSTRVLFEQNVQATWLRFKGLIEPFLANVQVQFGITDYRLILDESTTTPDLIDQNIMYAKIMIKPAKAIEYIAIDFVIASTGASFDD